MIDAEEHVAWERCTNLWHQHREPRWTKRTCVWERQRLLQLLLGWCVWILTLMTKTIWKLRHRVNNSKQLHMIMRRELLVSLRQRYYLWQGWCAACKEKWCNLTKTRQGKIMRWIRCTHQYSEPKAGFLNKWMRIEPTRTINLPTLSNVAVFYLHQIGCQLIVLCVLLLVISSLRIWFYRLNR
jgi:hypothetical protein